MKLHPPRVACPAAMLLAGLTLAAPGAARFASLGESVPIDRLLKNVGDYVAKRPNDAKGHYVLGRIHSLAFTQTVQEVRVITRDRADGEDRPLALPEFHRYTSVLLVERDPGRGDLDAKARQHLARSVQHYRRATQLAPKEALYWLGYGWMLEQGAPYATVVAAPFLPRPRKVGADAWLEQALAAYRRAHALMLQDDLKQESFYATRGSSISLEAGEGILRLLGRRPLTEAEKREVEEIQKSVKILRDKPRWITPILFPLNGAAPLSALLAPGRTALFDLDGDGRKERWPWVGPDTGILVWDSERTGRIASGRQLFGSVTWAMFWRDGYEPLAALDDDRDGWLSGRELAGLAVWRDRNGNGISDRGEVSPLQAMGVVRVAVRAAGRSGGALHHPEGLQRRDGTALPTYDWTPRSIAPEPRAAGP